MPIERSGGGGGGTTSPLTTKGDLWGFDVTNDRVPVGSNTQVLPADSAQALGVKWAAVPALASGKVNLTSGDITTTSGTFVDLTGVTVTITTGARRCLVVFTATTKNSAINGQNVFDIAIDGTRLGGTTGLVIVTIPAANFNENPSFSYVTDVLSAAAHTFKIQWFVSPGTTSTGTVYASATTPVALSVVELYT